MCLMSFSRGWKTELGDSGRDPALQKYLRVKQRIQKYLKNRAAISPWVVEGVPRTDFSAALVIPALGEKETLPQTLSRLCENPPTYRDQTVIIVVVNNRKGVSSPLLDDNRETLAWLKTAPFPQLNLAWIDASSAGVELPPRDGVGLARKIGFDGSLSRLNWGSDPLLISLDADTLVDSDYLQTIFHHFSKSRAGGAVIPFRHQQAESLREEAAIRRYELYLRSYLFGLELAGSPYAYHTIGSAFACRARSYIKSGGMNRRCGGEDFYFLQQLAKDSAVEMLRGTVVRPSPRFSERVPFGTGRVVQSQVEGDDKIRFVSAFAFKRLRAWLDLVTTQVDSFGPEIIAQAQKISPSLTAVLDELDFLAVWEKLQKNHATPKQRLTAFHCWFDALRSRQLLTRLDGETESPSQPVVEELLHWGGYPGVKNEDDQLRLLEQLQGVAQ